MKEKLSGKKDPKLQSALKHSQNSRDSVHGYLEMGNDAEVHAKARAMMNNNNDSHE